MPALEVPAETDRSAAPLSPVRMLLAGLLGALLLGALGLLLAMAANRPFQVDEVEHVHAAYELRVGRLIYRDFRQAHDPLLYPLLEPLIDPSDPAASFRRARFASTGLLIGTVLLVGVCAYRSSNWLGAWLAGGLCLTHTTLLERGMEVRPDGAVALCTAAALAVDLSGWSARRRFVLEGLLLSTAFLFTNKAAFPCFAFGCLWLFTALRRRSPGLLVWPMAAWTLPLAVTAGIMAWLGNLGPFLELNVFNATSEILGTAVHTTRFGPWHFLVHEGVRNPVFSVLAVAGLAYGVARAAGGRIGRPPESAPAGSGGGGLPFTTFLALVLVASLWLNPFPFPYLHVTVLPTLAVLAGSSVARLAQRWGVTASHPIGLLLVLLLVGAAFSRLVPATHRGGHPVPGPSARDPGGDPASHGAGRPGVRHGRPLLPPRRALRLIDDREHLLPILLGRVGADPQELRRTGTVALIVNYRTAWLGEEDRRFLAAHFVHYDGNVFLLGADLSDLPVGETRRFEALAGKRFRFEGRGSIEVDGAPFAEGVLARGPHEIRRVSGGGPSRLIVATPEPVSRPPRPPSRLFVNFD